MGGGLPGGVVHDLPGDLEAALLSDDKARATWHNITPLARNEWICWVTSPKTQETRTKRVRLGIENLAEGKRRPCCCPGLQASLREVLLSS
ncbi:YdeI/OmpD-associated family protein [Sphingomonas kaistensis]|uniref:YdeI/OmpD-associated family protein n=1 Tax=Sphingomonas kaistensis TaxID=298708 RepID=A0ABZ2G1P6_9SPHN